jgi:hypothetical protein
MLCSYLQAAAMAAAAKGEEPGANRGGGKDTKKSGPKKSITPIGQPKGVELPMFDNSCSEEDDDGDTNEVEGDIASNTTDKTSKGMGSKIWFYLRSWEWKAFHFRPTVGNSWGNQSV